MTIKDFAKLCKCNPQTLRYYDKENLLKPNRVDHWTGYRYYSEEQALDFVKIKNLQEADFSIKEIKELLTKDDEDIYQAFEKKIQDQVAKLERIRKIQISYLSEKKSMEATLREIKEKVLMSAREYNAEEEFGISKEYYENLIANVNDLFETSIRSMGQVDFSEVKTGDGKDTVEEEEYLNPLENDAYRIIYEKHGWEKTKEVLMSFPKLEDGEYLLYFETGKSKMKNMAFCTINLGYVLDQNGGRNLQLGCNITESKDDQNHFWLLKAKAPSLLFAK